MANANQKNGENPTLQTEKFFADLEDRIVQRLRNEASSDEGRRELLETTGIRDPKLLDELGTLGITADGLAALRLYPLVLVAWAEACVDRPERDVVVDEAHRIGIQDGSTAAVLLDRWLKRQPARLSVDAWKRYTHDMFADMSDVAQRKLIELTERQMTAVAKASGGHLGFGKISKKEGDMIQQVIVAMRQQTLMH